MWLLWLMRFIIGLWVVTNNQVQDLYACGQYPQHVRKQLEHCRFETINDERNPIEAGSKDSEKIFGLTQHEYGRARMTCI